MPYADQAERSPTVLEEHVQELSEECRAVIEESKYYIAESRSLRERSGGLLAASQNLRTDSVALTANGNGANRACNKVAESSQYYPHSPRMEISPLIWGFFVKQPRG